MSSAKSFGNILWSKLGAIADSHALRESTRSRRRRKISHKDTKTLRGRESGNSPAFAKPTARQAAKRHKKRKTEISPKADFPLRPVRPHYGGQVAASPL